MKALHGHAPRCTRQRDACLRGRDAIWKWFAHLRPGVLYTCTSVRIRTRAFSGLERAQDRGRGLSIEVHLARASVYDVGGSRELQRRVSITLSRFIVSPSSSSLFPCFSGLSCGRYNVRERVYVVFVWAEGDQWL